MARPNKEGLEYFSLDTDIANDDKIKLIKAKHGLIGFAIVVLLLTKIYKEGSIITGQRMRQITIWSRKLNIGPKTEQLQSGKL